VRRAHDPFEGDSREQQGTAGTRIEMMNYPSELKKLELAEVRMA
jgi:hypothetical protein